MSAQPPLLVLQALAVPVIALVGAWIAARQMLIANEKLQLDDFVWKYDRRFAVFTATREILEKVFRNIAEDDIRVYGLRALDAQFLFDEEESVYKYLRELHQRITAWQDNKIKADAEKNEDKKAIYRKIEKDNLAWITQQGDERSGFTAKFRPFLMHKQATRPWLLRWP